MRKANRDMSARKTGGKENLNLLREIIRDIHDEDNMVAQVLKVGLKKDESDDRFESLKVFPPKWWR